MFKIALKPTFVSRVDVETPNNKGGFDTSHFFCEFKRVNMEEQEQLRKEKPADYLPRVIVGFTELIDGNDNKVDFNEENLRALLSIPNAVIATHKSFWEAVGKVKEKN